MAIAVVCSINDTPCHTWNNIPTEAKAQQLAAAIRDASNHKWTWTPNGGYEWTAPEGRKIQITGV